MTETKNPCIVFYWPGYDSWRFAGGIMLYTNEQIKNLRKRASMNETTLKEQL